MRNIIPELAFISAERKGLSTAENLERTTKLRGQLEAFGLKFRGCNGVYKGTKEYSFMVWLDHAKGMSHYAISDLATEFDQECILYRDNDRNAYLMGKDDQDPTNNYFIQSLGIMGLITPEQVTKLDSYTHFPLTDTYMGVVNAVK